MSMRDVSPEDGERLAALHDAALRLLAQAEPDLNAVERLADQARALTHSPAQQVADAAQRLELRLLGALLVGRATLLRRLARDLQRLARWLPPDQPERN